MNAGEKTVLAIDPGRQKHGMALVRRDADDKLHLIWRAIAQDAELERKVDEARSIRSFTLVIMGSGTCSRQTIERLSDYAPGLGVLVIDERDTTLQARERYWEYHPRRGWRKLLPASLQVPPEPVDDFAALILAERVLLGE